MTKLYNHTFFKWWDPTDLTKLQQTLQANYPITQHKPPKTETEISLYKDQRNEIEVKSPNMVAYLSPFRATLTQINDKPLDQKDIELRDIIKEHYPRDRPTPFPWSWNTEPPLKPK